MTEEQAGTGRRCQEQHDQVSTSMIGRIEPNSRVCATSELLTPQQAADLLQVPVSFIYERTRLNSIPVKRIGKYVRIPKAELLAWVDAQSPAV